jgi:hypothetical protein
MEEILGFIFNLIFAWPGAFVRWILFYRGKKTYKEVFMDDGYKNLSIGIMAMSCLGGLFYGLNRWITY